MSLRINLDASEQAVFDKSSFPSIFLTQFLLNLTSVYVNVNNIACEDDHINQITVAFCYVSDVICVRSYSSWLRK